MTRCIFCKSTTGSFTTREHILPESLGGGDWAILPSNLFCDACQNHFGSTVEKKALGDYPFSLFRVFLGIPTKKGRAPWFDSWEGVFRASPIAGHVGYDPSPIFRSEMDSGSKSQVRILAHPKKPSMVCRALLKMGIEVVAADNPADAFKTKFDAAREYALRGRKHGNWWYLQCEDMQKANRFIKGCVSIQEWLENFQLSVVDVADGIELFHLRLGWLDIMTPLESRLAPPVMSELPEPQYRLFVV